MGQRSKDVTATDKLTEFLVLFQSISWAEHITSKGISTNFLMITLAADVYSRLRALIICNYSRRLEIIGNKMPNFMRNGKPLTIRNG